MACVSSGCPETSMPQSPPLHRPRSLATRLAAILVGIALLTVGAPAHSKLSAVAKRLIRSGKTEQYTIHSIAHKIPGGAARRIVHAPLDVVKKVVTKFGTYAAVDSRFRRSRIVGRTKGSTDVYLQIAIMSGVKKLWSLLRFREYKSAGRVRIEGTQRRGNMDVFEVTWSLTKVDAKRTLLRLELVMDPSFFLPAEMMHQEMLVAAETMVTRLSRKAQERAKRKR